MLEDILKTNGFNGMVDGLHGYIVYNKNDMYVGRSIKEYGEYSEAEVGVFRDIIKQGQFVMDIGANIGTHTMAMSELVGDDGIVLSFEPQPAVFQTLCANVAVNSLDNVFCYQFIVTDSTGVGFVPSFNYREKNNFGGFCVDEYNSGNRVMKIALDDYFNGIARLDFMKIDVEGHEMSVLRGARNLIDKFSPVLYVENDRIDKSKELMTMIGGMGYTMYWDSPPLFNENNYAGNEKNVFANECSVNMLCVRGGIDTNVEPANDYNFHPMKKETGDE